MYNWWPFTCRHWAPGRWGLDRCWTRSPRQPCCPSHINKLINNIHRYFFFRRKKHTKNTKKNSQEFSNLPKFCQSVTISKHSKISFPIIIHEKQSFSFEAIDMRMSGNRMSMFLVAGVRGEGEAGVVLHDQAVPLHAAPHILQQIHTIPSWKSANFVEQIRVFCPKKIHLLHMN